MTQRAKILIVDDRPQNLAALRMTLADVDADVIEASNGNDALAASLHHDFALAILDVMMPGMDGLELAEHLRGDARTRRLPIIFLTAAAGEELQIFQGYDAGAVDYILKPYHPKVLLAKVGVFLELGRQRDELIAAYRELDAFAYAVSHDLRAPLRALNGFAAALREDLGQPLSELVTEDLGSIEQACHRMAELIEGLLALSRYSRGELRRRDVDLSGLALCLLNELAAAEPARRVIWEVEPNIEMCGDPRMVEAVMANLLSNAWKYSGQVEEAHIRVYRGGLGCCVADNGAGFDMALAAQLFEPFRRLHKQDQFPGIGIGLATVQRIVQRHGGRIEATGSVGKGATFTFSLGSE